MPPDPPTKKRLRRSIVNRASNIHYEPFHAKRLATPLCIMYYLLFTFCFCMPVDTHKETQKGSNQESMQSGTRMIKLENSGLRAPRKMCLGSGLHSQKRIRAPVSKMVRLRAPQQKFQGSRAPGNPPLGP